MRRSASLIVFVSLVAGSFAHAQMPSITEVPPGTLDAARHVLYCYHPSGRFEYATDEGPWSEQSDFGASRSRVLLIRFRGMITNAPYRLRVAILKKTRNGQPHVKAEIIEDTALFSPKSSCVLNSWQVLLPDNIIEHSILSP
ncbi:MAG: hypothetical protein GC191_20130 [Azospirillum sp.]|nr:hypothetical protein [Azospirillum sp.]